MGFSRQNVKSRKPRGDAAMIRADRPKRAGSERSAEIEKTG
jgi:hypothetical protein